MGSRWVIPPILSFWIAAIRPWRWPNWRSLSSGSSAAAAASPAPRPSSIVPRRRWRKRDVNRYLTIAPAMKACDSVAQVGEAVMKKFIGILALATVPTLAAAAEKPDWAFPVTEKVQPPARFEAGKVRAAPPGSTLSITRAKADDMYDIPNW